VEIGPADPLVGDVRELLEEHLRDMFATSPPESVHALDPVALTDPAISFFAARENGVLLGVGALRVGPEEGELKSMRTTASARGRGVATAMLVHLVDLARERGVPVVRLETGVEDYFAPARRLYERHGFIPCAPFADYVLDPNSVFYERRLD
jgi:putative acetyltransferase